MADNMNSSHDIVMKEEPVPEPSIASIQQTTAADLTDPNPPPQPIAAQQPQAPSTFEPPTASLPAIPALAAAAATGRPGSIPPTASARPEKPVAHGGPTRQYLNQNITPHLLEGMKYLAMHEPEKPLAWLAEFLKDRSKQVEG
ncbi:hypothetical protein AMS68_001931 [Peltaster fructicola]|uniref:Dpy-30 domain-containing protein n=1 Tax=Peltaster fructicola TaxID=286661 RepID=A0A6H0XNW2_9PEZI|nr:hypothetical protein AMS68_001931 [Peltaster fructicola]